MIRTAVIGAGHQGRYHAQKYAALPEAELVAVADVDGGRARRVAADTGASATTDHRELLDQVDAVSIAAPTSVHHSIARAALDAGVHVLVEKPVCVTVAEAEDLVGRARGRGLVLQVGHLERFNPALRNVETAIGEPLFIESHRLAPFKGRGNDVDVVLDLMIHDIDLIGYLVGSPVESLDASGTAVLSDSVDIANARLRFRNGCVANVTASRVTLKEERKLRIFQPEGYLSLDLHGRRASIYRRTDGKGEEGLPGFTVERRCCESSDALEDQISSFLNAVRTESAPLVSGEDGCRALETAIRITNLVGEPRRAGAGRHEEEEEPWQRVAGLPR